MPAPRPVWVYHFTHPEHLATVQQACLVADASVERPPLAHEAADREIKERRRHRIVTAGRGGVVADYVPFYFAPRSPMMFKIAQGGVPTFDDDVRNLVYLCSTIERLAEAQVPLVITDRNAATGYAHFTTDPGVLDVDTFVDWPLMSERTRLVLLLVWSN